ncbi:hypothetical protein RIF29_45430 [Crotalaria pallida]|uniref:Uncharacterized protein n=1 Tax=Crotalaria pallida TaxID=3830 RepID=A0AAN9E051_CROPI
MAGRKSYLEASYGCAKKMKETGTLLVQSVISETADVRIKEVDYNLGTKLNAACSGIANTVLSSNPR